MRFLRWITPFAVLAIFITGYLFYFLLNEKTAGELKAMIAVPLIITALIVIVIDVVLRLVFRHKIHYTWIAEAILFIAAIYLFIIN